jgi:hypothetical protein
MILFLASTAWSQNSDLPYSSGSVGTEPLSIPNTFTDRYGFAYCYDQANDNIVLFSGRRYSPATNYIQTLIFNGTEWVDVQPNTFVSARIDAGMVYDASVGNANVVMFGGLRADNVTLDETWIWNGADWTEVTPDTVPPARRLHEMVYDSVANRVIMFGGLNAANQVLTDMWAWDGTDWTALAPTNVPENGYTYQDYDSMFFDPVGNRIVLFNPIYQKTYVFDIGTLTWSVLSTPTRPNPGSHSRMVYNSAAGYALVAGGSSNAQTWKFENDEWIQLSPASGIPRAWSYGLVFNPDDGQIYRFYGTANSTTYQSTHVWDGTTWAYVVGRSYTFDMVAESLRDDQQLQGNPDGVYQYTSIFVPANVDVFFKKNPANTPVTWLASENVTINGNLVLDGQSSADNDQSGSFAKGGPGGFDAGVGGVRFDVSGSYLATPGQGPGGGVPQTTKDQHGRPGTYNGTYGNRLIQPLIGGSGGSGATSGDSTNGGNGGAGGGAILIASSKDVIINGGIYARGGTGVTGATSWNSRYGGGGSGGAIRVVADRITGGGTINANGGGAGGGATGGAGRIRLEAFYRPIAPNATPVPSATAPTETDALSTNRELWIANVAGEPVGEFPTGSLIEPDIVFSTEGEITVTVQSTNIPEGTPVNLRITTSEGIINLPAELDPEVTIGVDGSASFTTTVPAGLGTIQATAEFTLQ